MVVLSVLPIYNSLSPRNRFKKVKKRGEGAVEEEEEIDYSINRYAAKREGLPKTLGENLMKKQNHKNTGGGGIARS